MVIEIIAGLRAKGEKVYLGDECFGNEIVGYERSRGGGLVEGTTITHKMWDAKNCVTSTQGIYLQDPTIDGADLRKSDTGWELVC